MTLKDSVQTAFLVVGFFTILVFGASYYFMFLDADPTDQPLKDSLAITASFFGGFATLTAAYIASKLFNDWRDEKEYELAKESSLSLLKATLNINSTLESFLAITYEFTEFKEDAEFNEYCKWCDDFSRDFMGNLIKLKTENNLHHGLILDYKNDEKLFLQENLFLMMQVFNQISDNVCTTVDNHNTKAKNPIKQINLKEYSEMIRPKIEYLNKKCKPPKMKANQ